MIRAANDNALLGACRPRRAFEAGAWMLAYGLAIGGIWYGALVIGVTR